MTNSLEPRASGLRLKSRQQIVATGAAALNFGAGAMLHAGLLGEKSHEQPGVEKGLSLFADWSNLRSYTVRTSALRRSPRAPQRAPERRTRHA